MTWTACPQGDTRLLLAEHPLPPAGKLRFALHILPVKQGLQRWELALMCAQRKDVGLMLSLQRGKGKMKPHLFSLQSTTKNACRVFGIVFQRILYTYIYIHTYMYTHTYFYICCTHTHTHSLSLGPAHLSGDHIRVDLHTLMAWAKYIHSVCKHPTHLGKKKNSMWNFYCHTKAEVKNLNISALFRSFLLN